MSEPLKTPLRILLDGDGLWNILDAADNYIGECPSEDHAAAIVEAVNGAGTFTPIAITPDEASVCMAEALDEANARIAELEAGLGEAMTCIKFMQHEVTLWEPGEERQFKAALVRARALLKPKPGAAHTDTP